MSMAEFAAATRGEPMPDQAVRIAFAVSEGGLTISNDAPPLSRGRVSGLVTGRNTAIRGANAEIRMPDGRRSPSRTAPSSSRMRCRTP